MSRFFLAPPRKEEIPVSRWIADFYAFAGSRYRHIHGVPTEDKPEKIFNHLNTLADHLRRYARDPRGQEDRVEDCRIAFIEAVKHMADVADRIPHRPIKYALRYIDETLKAEKGDFSLVSPSRYEAQAKTVQHLEDALDLRETFTSHQAALCRATLDFLHDETEKKSHFSFLYLPPVCGSIRGNSPVLAEIQSLFKMRLASLASNGRAPTGDRQFLFCFEAARCAGNLGNKVMRDFALGHLKDAFHGFATYDPDKARRMIGNWLRYYDRDTAPAPGRSLREGVVLRFHRAAKSMLQVGVVYYYVPPPPPHKECFDPKPLNLLRALRSHLPRRTVFHPRPVPLPLDI